MKLKLNCLTWGRDSFPSLYILKVPGWGSETSHWAVLWYSNFASFLPHPRDQWKVEGPKHQERVLSARVPYVLWCDMPSMEHLCNLLVSVTTSWWNAICLHGDRLGIPTLTGTAIFLMWGTQTLQTSWHVDAQPKEEGSKSSHIHWPISQETF